MDIITNPFNLASKRTTDLKGLYCLLFNRLSSPCLPECEKQAIRAAIKKVTAELQTRHTL